VTHSYLSIQPPFLVGGIMSLGDKHSGAGCDVWRRGSAIAFSKLSVWR